MIHKSSSIGNPTSTSCISPSATTYTVSPWDFGRSMTFLQWSVVILLMLAFSSISLADSKVNTADVTNVNTADAEALQAIPGIGKVKSTKIVKYRQENGPFKHIEEMVNVVGIGLKLLENIKPYITIGEPVSSLSENVSKLLTAKSSAEKQK